MKINDFQVKDEMVKKEMEKKLESFKLEKVLSLWYFVVAASKATIVGSKNKSQEMPLNQRQSDLEALF